MRRELGRQYPCFERDLKSFFDLINRASFVQESLGLETVASECMDVFKLSNINDNRNPVDVAISFQKLALLFLDKGDDVEAKRLFLIALEYYGSIRVANWSVTSPTVGLVILRIGSFLKRTSILMRFMKNVLKSVDDCLANL